MDWQQKAEALAGLGEFSIIFRERQNRIGSACAWYAGCAKVEIKDNGIMRGGWGNGNTPQEAIEDYWRYLTELKPHEYVLVRAYDDAQRRAVRWNGFMWADVQEPKRDAAA